MVLPWASGLDALGGEKRSGKQFDIDASKSTIALVSGSLSVREWQQLITAGG